MQEARGLVTLSRPIQFAIIAAAVVGAITIIWFTWIRKITPEQAVRELGHRLVAGDMKWLFDNATEEERSIPGFTLQLLEEFWSERGKPLFDGAKIIDDSQSLTTPEFRAVIEFQVKLRDGSEHQVGIFAHSIDGKPVYAIIENLTLFIGKVEFAHIEGTPERVRQSWKSYREWFRERGLTKWYSTQDGNFHPM
jgi:hypothetical protein